ncbi:hypothetical protein PVAP13_2NG507403 [Panicum virgatum]|uniref:Uncharacterized protein n=1 Tax=Panicum virgatum TaxID=38727 RepID=A0A8T0VKB5_PANVG|nr:hypothetical protein PVAP13_2NG507403 [Panicum virgatum]
MSRGGDEGETAIGAEESAISGAVEEPEPGASSAATPRGKGVAGRGGDQPPAQRGKPGMEAERWRWAVAGGTVGEAVTGAPTTVAAKGVAAIRGEVIPDETPEAAFYGRTRVGSGQGGAASGGVARQRSGGERTASAKECAGGGMNGRAARAASDGTSRQIEGARAAARGAHGGVQGGRQPWRRSGQTTWERRRPGRGVTSHVTRHSGACNSLKIRYGHGAARGGGGGGGGAERGPTNQKPNRSSRRGEGEGEAIGGKAAEAEELGGNGRAGHSCREDTLGVEGDNKGVLRQAEPKSEQGGELATPARPRGREQCDPDGRPSRGEARSEGGDDGAAEIGEAGVQEEGARAPESRGGRTTNMVGDGGVRREGRSPGSGLGSRGRRRQRHRQRRGRVAGGGGWEVGWREGGGDRPAVGASSLVGGGREGAGSVGMATMAVGVVTGVGGGGVPARRPWGPARWRRWPAGGGGGAGGGAGGGRLPSGGVGLAQSGP